MVITEPERGPVMDPDQVLGVAAEVVDVAQTVAAVVKPRRPRSKGGPAA